MPGASLQIREAVLRAERPPLPEVLEATGGVSNSPREFDIKDR